MIKKLSALFLGAALIMSIFSGTVFASTSKVAQAENKIDDYLKAVQASNVDKIVKYVSDTRFKNEDLKQSYENLLKKDKEKLTSFKIVKKEELQDASYKFIVELKFKNGGVSEVPFKVVYVQNDYKIEITPSSLETADYQIIDSSNPATQMQTSSLVTTTSTFLDDWTFSRLFNIMYGVDYFNVSKSTTSCSISGDQTKTSDSQPGYVSDVQYAVVQQHWYGDTVWGSVRETGEGYYSDTIYRNSGISTTADFTDAQIRISRYGPNYNWVDGNGSLYAN